MWLMMAENKAEGIGQELDRELVGVRGLITELTDGTRKKWCHFLLGSSPSVQEDIAVQAPNERVFDVCGLISPRIST